MYDCELKNEYKSTNFQLYSHIFAIVPIKYKKQGCRLS